MTGATRLLGALTAQRAVELAIAGRNTKALLARGAYESGAGHYPAMVSMHAAWLATLWLFGRKRRLQPPFVAMLALLQLARMWILATLGKRWTTRIIVLPNAPRVTSGPYRFVRHPNYAVVALELPCVSLALGLRAHALAFAAANLGMLAWRIRAEDRAYGLDPGGSGADNRISDECDDDADDERASRS